MSEGGSITRHLRDPNDVRESVKKVETSGLPPVLERAVVIDVISDPDELTEEEKDEMAQYTGSSRFVDMIPRNSIIGRIESNEAGQTAQSNILAFPFFSSHMILPVQPGETVYVVQENLGRKGVLSYWFTRVHAFETVEDPNYCHYDRCLDPTFDPSKYSGADRELLKGKDVPPPGFPNGGNTSDEGTWTLVPGLDDDKDVFEQIKQDSKGTPLTTPEPVPRWKKRPQDFVLQGTNNTLISFGEDRTGGLENEADAKGQAGTIDMVVGRGRKLPASEDEEPEGNAPWVVKNVRGLFETDKARHRKGEDKKNNPNEGNPDFGNDATRLYASMQTNGDENFGLKTNPENSLSLPAGVISSEGTDNRAFLIGKSDHIRFIARKDTEKGIAGTIFLVREGEPDEDLGYFLIDENGQCQIESNKIYLGKATSEWEPMILYTRFRETVMRLQDEIHAIKNEYEELTVIISQAFDTAFGNLGAPIPSLSKIGGSQASANMKISKERLFKKINEELEPKVLEASSYEVQSNKIYNEPRET